VKQEASAMQNSKKMAMTFVAMLGWAGTLSVANEAWAIQYGELRIHSNTTLTDDRYGDVAFDASNITLDCANHQVHASSFTKLNGGEKVAIYAASKSGITIKNCKIVGVFDKSLRLEQTTNAVVQNVSASTPALFVSNNGVNVSGLTVHSSISIFIEDDVAGSYSANVACAFEGIHVDDCTDTTLLNTTVTGCSNNAIVGGGNDGLRLDGVDAENSFSGFAMQGDTNDDVRNSVFSNNSYNGIGLFGASANNFFGDNTALGNGNCDAYDDPASQGDSWAQNTFATICGDVPAAH
jgi:hypothetical protein